MAIGSSKVYCPTCNATSGNANFGRDGQRRWMDSTRFPLSDDPKIAKRRARAAKLRAMNAIA